MTKLKYKDKDGFWQELPVGANGNTEEVTVIKTEYAEQLAKRKEARDKINELEAN